jgi:hypothetical protein
MLFNELAQWALILALVVFVFGLIRQLGQFLVPRRDHLLYLGPDIGRVLPTGLLAGLPVERIKTRISDSGDGMGLIAIMNDRCAGCRGMILQLETLGQPIDGPLLAIVDTDDAEYIKYLERVFTYVIKDQGGTRAHDAGIIATPFVLAVDDDLRVKHRGIAGGLHELVGEWAGLRRDLATATSSGDGAKHERPLEGVA